VRDAVAVARRQAVPLSIRSDRHALSGRSTNDGGIAIDLSAMNAIDVRDPGDSARYAARILLADISSNAVVARPLGETAPQRGRRHSSSTGRRSPRRASSTSTSGSAATAGRSPTTAR
jgi:hypothetical protein